VYVGGWPYWGDYYAGDDGDYTSYYDDDYDNSAPDSGAPTSSWYYCRNPAGYYPYVQNCAVEWLPVSPVPPNISPSN
jgi:hypothetical protein